MKLNRTLLIISTLFLTVIMIFMASGQISSETNPAHAGNDISVSEQNLIRAIPIAETGKSIISTFDYGDYTCFTMENDIGNRVETKLSIWCQYKTGGSYRR